MPPSLRTAIAKDSIEIRRARGEISCAECRRHKLKCDKSNTCKQIPCSSCVRKGCASICPNGTLSPVHGLKQNGSDASARDSRVVELTKRIRELEDALQISHGAVSSETHPLLTKEFLQIKNGTSAFITQKRDDDSADADLAESLGTLAISTRGTELYFGGVSDLFDATPVSSHWVDCRMNRQEGHLDSFGVSPASDPSLVLPTPISYLSKAFPFSPLYLPANEIQVHIEEKLPSYARASALVEAYLENLSWFFRPVDRQQIMEELLPTVYKRKRRWPAPPRDASRNENSDAQTPLPTDPHALALLFAVFAAGAIADMTLPPWNDEGELYHHLSRTALSLKPVFEGAGLLAVQAIALNGGYHLFSCRTSELDGTWKVMSFALSLAASIGLHRDPAHFNLSTTAVQRRRRVFWELYTIDVWKSMCTGRPVTFTPSVIDCELPEDTDAVPNEDGTPGRLSIWLQRHRYTKEIMMDIVSRLGAVRSVKYSELLALDQQIREYDPQGTFDLGTLNNESEQSDNGLLMKRIQLPIYRDMTLLHLHRNFFAHALVKDPINPVHTRFGPSFLSVYRSATAMVHEVHELFEQSKHLLMRCWPVWGHTLHAAVILGSIAALGASSALAPQAFIHFSVALELFSKAQVHPLVKHEMPMLERLRDHALQSLAKHGNAVFSESHSAEPHSMNSVHEPNTLGKIGRSAENGFEIFGFKPMSSGDSEHVRAAPEPRSTTTYTPDAVRAQLSGIGQHADYPYHSQGPRELQMADHLTEHVSNMSDEPSQMQVDQNMFLSDGGSHDAINHFYNGGQVFDNSAAPGTNGHDALDAFTTFSNAPGSSFLSGPIPSFVPELGHTQLNLDGHLSSIIDPLAYSTPRLSPGSPFSSDFDVSFDMRASVGQENVVPLLPEDMDAWRAILRDSRFFGILDESFDSGKSTPR